MPSVPSNIFTFMRAASRYIRETKSLESSELYARRKKDSHAVLDKFGIELSHPEKSAFEANGPSIYVGNHTSLLDALFVYAAFEIDIRILAKESLFSVPYLGKILKREKHLCVHRGKNASDRNTNIRNLIHEAIAEGASIMFFPEGTRSATGKLGEFKLGAFYNAVQNGVHVVPVVIRGAYEAMPKTTLKIIPGKCSLELLSPIELPEESMGDETTRAKWLSEQTRNAIQEALGK